MEPRDGEPADQFGMPVRLHYLLVGLIAFSVGFITMAFSLTENGEQLRHPVIYAICLAGTAVPVAFYVIARRANFEFKEWLIMSVLVLAVVGPFFCFFFIGTLKPALLTLFMLGPIGAAYYAPLRRAWPVIAFGTGSILFFSAQIDEPDAMGRGVVVATITVACALMLATIRDHLTQTVESNREISERDPLTGAFNLHKFHERLDEEIKHSINDGEVFALVEFDLDNFREVNERHGRSAGDDVLIASTEAIQTALTPHDVLVRRGADQFVVIAPFIPSRNLHATTLLARDRIAAARRALCPEITPTACAGWAIHDRHEDATSIINRADDALHDSKRAAELTGGESLVWRDLRESQSHERAESHVSLEVAELRRRRREEAEIGDDPMWGAMRIAWRTSAYSTFALAVVLLIMGMAGALSFPITGQHYLLFVGWALIMSPLALWATQKKRAPYVDHVLCIAGLTMTMATCLVAREAAPAAVEMFMMSALLYLTLLPFRWAAFYASITYAAYAAFLIVNHYPASDIRIVTTLVNFGFVGAILALTRHHAIKAADDKAVLARTDALTGLANMRQLKSWLVSEVARAEKEDFEIALLAMNLDDFKGVNDVHGHVAGDDLLVAVAGALRQTGREADLAARRSGDEFLLAMSGADESDAAEAASQIANAVRFARARIAPEIPGATTIGWVVWEPGETAEELIALAGKAVQDAKDSSDDGRQPEVELA
jgi:diguanylate cyclase (GGDEF)-like protein